MTLFIFSFIGAFTSLAAFALESYALADGGKHTLLFLNLLATVFLALAAVVLGKLTVSLLGQPATGIVKQTYRIMRAALQRKGPSVNAAEAGAEYRHRSSMSAVEDHRVARSVS